MIYESYQIIANNCEISRGSHLNLKIIFYDSNYRVIKYNFISFSIKNLLTKKLCFIKFYLKIITNHNFFLTLYLNLATTLESNLYFLVARFQEK